MKILLTACGCPGASTLIQMLYAAASADDEPLHILGVDCDPDAIGRFMCDDFRQVPPVSSQRDYELAVQALVAEIQPDVILPESSPEVPILSRMNLRVPVLVSQPDAVTEATSKYLTYQAAERVGVDLPRWYWPQNLNEFVQAITDLGYPERPVCFKPHVAKGGRGFRVLDSRVSRREQLLEKKPNARYVSLQEFVSIFSEDEFPDLLVMEYLEGEEVTADVLCMDGEVLLVATKTNEQARWGVTVKGELVERPEIVEQVRKIVREIGLSYCVNLQFIGGKLIEINPRVSTFIYQPDLVFPWLAVKLALGRTTPDEVKDRQKDVQIGRRFVRYMDQVFH